MIRSNLPTPLLYRLRMRANTLARRARVEAYRRGSATDSQRVVRRSPLAVRRCASGYTPLLWSQFIEHYECFTGALCAAAKHGCTVAAERDYTTVRRWFRRYYPLIAPCVRPQLEFEFRNVPGFGASGKRGADVLEMMFQPASLREILRRDNGDLLPKIGRISDAVYRCNAVASRNEHSLSSRANYR